MSWFGGKCKDNRSGVPYDNEYKRCPIDEKCYRNFIGWRYGRHTLIRKHECSKCRELFEKTATPIEAESRDEQGLQVPLKVG